MYNKNYVCIIMHQYAPISYKKNYKKTKDIEGKDL